ITSCNNVPVLDSIAPNEVLRIRGGCMGPLEPQQAATNGKLPTSIGGTRVLFDGVPAPLLSVQSAEILAIVPQRASIAGNIAVAIENQGVKATASLDASVAAPGVYVVGNTTQADAFNHADSTLNGKDHPAPVGSLVSIFLTGSGVTSPQLDDG